MASNASEDGSKNEAAVFWKCPYCCYKNQSVTETCKICRKATNEETEYLPMAEWNFRENEQRKATEKRQTSQNTVGKSFRFIGERDLTDEKTKIAEQLILMGHAKRRAFHAARESETYEQAQEMCNKQKEKEKRITDLVGDNILTTHKRATLAVTLMDLGHDRMMAIHAARTCDDLAMAKEMLQKVCRVGNQCLPIKEIQAYVRKILAEDGEMTKEKAEIAAKLALIGYDLDMAIRSAKQYETYELATCACMKELSIQKRVDELLEEEILSDRTKAEIAVKLTELGHSIKDAILTARKVQTLEAAISSLEKECYICMETYPQNEMISMLYCPHVCCRQCTKSHFTISIREKNIADILCPFCNEPDLHNKDNEDANDYFVYLSELLKRIIEPSVYDVFQTKLRDYALMNDPDFYWCTNCKDEFGFCVDPRGRRLVCPKCGMVICVQCKQTWDDNHAGMSCKEFADWKTAQVLLGEQSDIRTYLKERGIVCPNCRYQYELARGGCMHFTCSQCKHQFCCGCNQPFLAGSKCKRSAKCAILGLHSHHPRNCFYFLRDTDVDLLKQLLHDHKVFNTGENECKNASQGGNCPIVETRETSTGYKDEICGKKVEREQAGLCRSHYHEYITSLLVKNNVDPVWIMDIYEIEAELTRNHRDVPKQLPKETLEHYTFRLRKFVNQTLPLMDLLQLED